jgi:hypothetical protein
MAPAHRHAGLRLPGNRQNGLIFRAATEDTRCSVAFIAFSISSSSAFSRRRTSRTSRGLWWPSSVSATASFPIRARINQFSAIIPSRDKTPPHQAGFCFMAMAQNFVCVTERAHRKGQGACRHQIAVVGTSAPETGIGLVAVGSLLLMTLVM